jgi:hypothetical protein
VARTNSTRKTTMIMAMDGAVAERELVKKKIKKKNK